MGTINSAIQLSNIRSKIDAQQQVVSLLEAELQKTILGDNTQTIGGVIGDIAAPTQNTIAGIYSGLMGPQDPNNSYGDGFDLYQALLNPFLLHFDYDSNGAMNEELDQTAIRQILYQARALLGEFRVEEQHWNQEVNEEKARRKDLGDFAKG